MGSVPCFPVIRSNTRNIGWLTKCVCRICTSFLTLTTVIQENTENYTSFPILKQSAAHCIPAFCNRISVLRICFTDVIQIFCLLFSLFTVKKTSIFYLKLQKLQVGSTTGCIRCRQFKKGEETAVCEADCRRRQGKASSCFATRGKQRRTGANRKRPGKVLLSPGPASSPCESHWRSSSFFDFPLLFRSKYLSIGSSRKAKLFSSSSNSALQF